MIAIDPVGLAALLTFTGTVTVRRLDTPITPTPPPTSCCASQYLALEDNAARIDALESLARATFDRLTTGDLPGPRTIADTLGDAVAGGTCTCTPPTPSSRRCSGDWASTAHSGRRRGRLPRRGEQQRHGQQGRPVPRAADRLRRHVDPRTGAVDATATVTLTNTASSSGLPSYVIGSAVSGPDPPPLGTNRTYLSIYIRGTSGPRRWTASRRTSRRSGTRALGVLGVRRRSSRGREPDRRAAAVRSGPGRRRLPTVRRDAAAGDARRARPGRRRAGPAGVEITASPGLHIDGATASADAVLTTERTATTWRSSVIRPIAHARSQILALCVVAVQTGPVRAQRGGPPSGR